LIEANKIAPIRATDFPLTDASKAYQQIETRHTRRKIALRVYLQPKS
jgi:hypothetical protein